MKLVYGVMAMLMMLNTAMAQEDTATKKINKKGTTIAFGEGGLTIKESKNMKEETAISIAYANIDLGVNTLMDNTVYTSAQAKNFLQVPQNLRNTNLFDLRTAKSINVNLWPVMARARLVNGKHQRIHLSTGVGVQVYNFRYSQGIDYVNNPLPLITLDSLGFRKNKLTITYLSVPLNFTFKNQAG